MRRDATKLGCCALAALCLLVAAGCGGGGGGGEQITFTQANYAQLVANADEYDGAHVEITGQVTRIDQQPDGVYLEMFANPEGNGWNTIVAIMDPEFLIQEYQWVRVTGTVRPKLELPDSFRGSTTEPVILADSALAVMAPPR